MAPRENWAPITVVESTYDFWYEIAKADEQLEPGEEPVLNADGNVYYVIVRPHAPGQSFCPDFEGFMTLDEALRGAESRLPGPVDWSRITTFMRGGNQSPAEWVEAELARKAELVRDSKAGRRRWSGRLHEP